MTRLLGLIASPQGLAGVVSIVVAIYYMRNQQNKGNKGKGATGEGGAAGGAAARAAAVDDRKEAEVRLGMAHGCLRTAILQRWYKCYAAPRISRAHLLLTMLSTHPLL